MENNEKIEKLRRLFSEINESPRRNDGISCVEKMITFKEGLKEVLYSNFKDEVIFDSDDSINYISGEYKGKFFGINTYDGISLSIDDNKFGRDILESFNPIISSIAGYPICKYNISFFDDDYKSLIYEWSLNPVRRLMAIKTDCFNPYDRIENLEDFYTPDLVKSLGNDLLTLNGFITIFNGIEDDVMSINDIVRIIDEVCPEIGYSNIIKWIKESKRQLSMKRSNKGENQ